MNTLARYALTCAAVLALAGCNAKDKAAEQAAAPTVSDKTLIATLEGDGSYATLAMVATNSGLSTALDGVGPYTLFAPPEAALKAGADFGDPTLKAQGAALLRAHVVPGAVTRADIAAAVDGAADKSAQMRTMAGELLTFSREGSDIIATAPDGARVRLTGAEGLVKNGVLQPVDGLLVKPAAG